MDESMKSTQSHLPQRNDQRDKVKVVTLQSLSSGERENEKRKKRKEKKYSKMKGCPARTYVKI